MSAHAALQKGLGIAFTVLSQQFMPDTVITLCKVSENYNEYDDLLDISEKRFFEFSNYRQNFLLEIADDNDTLTEAITEATHIRIVRGGETAYYSIRDGDTVRPMSTDVTWKLFADLHERRGKYGDMRD